MFSALSCALDARGVSAVLLAACVGVAYISRDRVDLEAVMEEARRPAPGCPAESLGYRFPAPGDYFYRTYPWIKSREDLIAHFTRGEDPDVVRRYVEGPEDELLDYLGEAFLRLSARYPEGIPATPPDRPGRGGDSWPAPLPYTTSASVASARTTR